MEYLNIILPVYNEHNRLRAGVEGVVNYMDTSLPGNYRVTVVDNASIDDTPVIANDLCAKYPQVHYLRAETKGVGLAFRIGVADNQSPIVGYMDVDLSTDIRHLDDMLRLFRDDSDLGIVNASRWNKESVTVGRKWYRNLTSHGFVAAMKLGLGMKASDAICGFKFFRREVVEALIDEAGEQSDGWFYIIELLLRAERGGVSIEELPVHWRDDYDSTVHVFAQTKEYLRDIADLRRRFNYEERHG